MSETDEDELDAIREKKREKLREKLADDGSENLVDDGSKNLADDGSKGEDTSGFETPTKPVEVTGREHLESLVADSEVLFLDCHADWCGPCKMMEPVIDEIAASTAAVVAKLDVDAHQGLAAELGARSIPTFVLFVDGQATNRLIGAQERATLERVISEAAS